MANKKISELTEAVSIDSADLLPIVDVSVPETKKITAQKIVDLVANSDLSISGTLVADMQISGSISNPIQESSYTLSSIDRGKTLLFSASATQGITCSSGLDVGFNCTFIQMGSGQLILSGASGVDLLNRQSHTGSAGQYAAVSIITIDSNTFIIAGDTI